MDKYAVPDTVRQPIAALGWFSDLEIVNGRTTAYLYDADGEMLLTLPWPATDNEILAAQIGLAEGLRRGRAQGKATAKAELRAWLGNGGQG